MNLADAMARIQHNARQIKHLLNAERTPENAATIHQHAQLIERETAHLAGMHTPTQGNA